MVWGLTVTMLGRRHKSWQGGTVSGGGSWPMGPGAAGCDSPLWREGRRRRHRQKLLNRTLAGCSVFGPVTPEPE